MPKRIQLARTKGYRKPSTAVVVSRPSKWGNPFKVEQVDRSWGGRLSRQRERTRRAEIAVGTYRVALETDRLSFVVGDVIAELRGKDLACWCRLGEPCHADVLLEIANR